ncbi:MAG: imidazole glycerol phosphate synthase subunit HisH [Chloroflexota bacterium]|nr:MAG: imidazole glycerol phosphate synthase subunit HisH [Chloroflexota bacterium]
MGDRKAVTVIDCGHGNLASVVNALRALGVCPVISSDPREVDGARVLIFPGQGAAPAAMASLRQNGLDSAICRAVAGGTALLGICLGMQVLLSGSEEGPVTALDVMPGDVKRFKAQNRRLKVPQIGWNGVRHNEDPLFAGVSSDTHFYFVHSYYCVPAFDAAIGWTEYGGEYCSALHRDNVWGVQFHPEKSGSAGLRLLDNFLRLSKC